MARLKKASASAVVVTDDIVTEDQEIEVVKEVEAVKEETFKVKVNKTFGVYIGNKQHYFEKNKTYNVSLGVKRYLLQTNSIIPE